MPLFQGALFSLKGVFMSKKIENIALHDLQKASNPFTIYNILISVSLLALFLGSWYGSEMSISSIISGWADMKSYMIGNPNIENSSFFPPSTNIHSITKYTASMIQTLMMAIVALVLSVAIAFPLSILASRNILNILIPSNSILHSSTKSAIYSISMLFANVFRSVNELVWALIFVSAVGLGPMAGILALAIHTAGVLTKLLAEGNESIDPGPIQALNSTGAGFIKILFYAVIPQTMPHFISMVLYRFESDVRSASILGFVGAGGIGFYLFDKIRGFENGDVTTIILIIVFTVWCIDKISAYIRSKFI